MTAKKDLKRIVRERQAKTGESYTAALAQVRAKGSERGERVEQIEVPEVTALAQQAGLTCRAFAARTACRLASSEAERGELLRSVFQHLKEILVVTGADPSMALLRGALLLGKPQVPAKALLSAVFTHRSFVARLRLGVGGVNADGTALAFDFPAKGGTVRFVALLLPSKADGAILMLSLADDWIASGPFLFKSA